MNIEFNNINMLCDIKEAVLVAFLKDDLANIKDSMDTAWHEDDIKYNKKLIKAYKTVLKYYGVNDE